MITRKNLSLESIFRFSGQHLLWLIPWMLAVPFAYHYLGWTFLALPWQPLSIVGTAVAFYVGFKNNQAYDRLWEARKIWGGLVNSSRKFATVLKNYKAQDSDEKAESIRKQMLYRHIAYVYQLREQLLKPAPWEHVSLNWVYGSYNQKRQKKYLTLYEKELNEIKENKYLSEEEYTSIKKVKNRATHLLDNQTQMVQRLYDMKAINEMQQIDLQNSIGSFYDDQGRAERIKGFPFPRQYGGYSFVFVSLFIFLLPFGIVGELGKLGSHSLWVTAALGVLIGWIYVVMEMIGDYSENPFEGLQNDVPMLAISRTIEIDLLQMINEPDIPEPIAAKYGFLI